MSLQIWNGSVKLNGNKKITVLRITDFFLLSHKYKFNYYVVKSNKTSSIEFYRYNEYNIWSYFCYTAYIKMTKHILPDGHGHILLDVDGYYIHGY